MMMKILKGIIENGENKFDGKSETLLDHQGQARRYLRQHYSAEMRGYELFLDVEIDSRLEKGFQYVPRFEHIGNNSQEILKIAIGQE